LNSSTIRTFRAKGLKGLSYSVIILHLLREQTAAGAALDTEGETFYGFLLSRIPLTALTPEDLLRVSREVLRLDAYTLAIVKP
jgi:hypothetical protein